MLPSDSTYCYYSTCFIFYTRGAPGIECLLEEIQKRAFNRTGTKCQADQKFVVDTDLCFTLEKIKEDQRVVTAFEEIREGEGKVRVIAGSVGEGYRTVEQLDYAIALRSVAKISRCCEALSIALGSSSGCYAGRELEILPFSESTTPHSAFANDYSPLLCSPTSACLTLLIS